MAYKIGISIFNQKDPNQSTAEQIVMKEVRNLAMNAILHQGNDITHILASKRTRTQLTSMGVQLTLDPITQKDRAKKNPARQIKKRNPRF